MLPCVSYKKAETVFTQSDSRNSWITRRLKLPSHNLTPEIHELQEGWNCLHTIWIQKFMNYKKAETVFTQSDSRNSWTTRRRKLTSHNLTPEIHELQEGWNCLHTIWPHNICIYHTATAVQLIYRNRNVIMRPSLLNNRHDQQSVPLDHTWLSCREKVIFTSVICCCCFGRHVCTVLCSANFNVKSIQTHWKCRTCIGRPVAQHIIIHSSIKKTWLECILFQSVTPPKKEEGANTCSYIHAHTHAHMHTHMHTHTRLTQNHQESDCHLHDLAYGHWFLNAYVEQN